MMVIDEFLFLERAQVFKSILGLKTDEVSFKTLQLAVSL